MDIYYGYILWIYIMNHIINIIGNNGYQILIIITTILLRNKDNLLLYFYIGIGINIILNILLKSIIRDTRPIYNNKEIHILYKNAQPYFYKDGIPYNIFGMPSGHSQLCFYIITFLILFYNKWNNLYYLLILILLITIQQRIISNSHSLLQIIVGAFIGILVAYLMFKLTEKNIIGKLSLKKDDNAPI